MLILAVWNNTEGKAEKTVDISKYAKGGSLKTVYPELPGFCAELDGDKLKVTLPDAKTAIYVVIGY